ncbi:MAG: tubulin-like doman-containing protein, partial [Thermoguttaceae bacterium]|nr:tubulin-like doman-containing protein [Thermoguttaceae bacterium]
SGGTGSGMVLDAGYAVRHALRGLGLPDDRVYGVLTHSTVHNPNAKGLAIANAYACLHEAEHYRRAGRYPGDPACGLPPFENDSGPFQTYLVHLGEDLSEPQYEAAVEAVAEYLYLDAITAVGRFLDAGRRPSDEKSSRPARGTVRTFAVAQIGYSQSAVTSAATEALCARVVRRWCGDGASRGDAGSAPSLGVGPTHTSPDMLPLELESWRAQAEACLHQELGGDIESFFRGALDRLGSSAGQSAPPSAPQVLGMINALLGDRLTPGDSTTSRIQTSLAKELKNRAAVQGASLGQWILELADASATRLDGARMAVQWAADRLRSLEAEADAALRDEAPRLAQAERQLLDGEPAQRTGRMGWLGIGRAETSPGARSVVRALPPAARVARASRHDPVAPGVARARGGLGGPVGRSAPASGRVERSVFARDTPARPVRAARVGLRSFRGCRLCAPQPHGRTGRGAGPRLPCVFFGAARRASRPVGPRGRPEGALG